MAVTAAMELHRLFRAHPPHMAAAEEAADSAVVPLEALEAREEAVVLPLMQMLGMERMD